MSLNRDEIRLLQSLEEALLDPATRSDPDRLRQLLDEDFEEVGASGRVFDRRAILDLLREESTKPAPARTLLSFRTRELADGLVQVRYTVRLADGEEQVVTERTSLWRREDDTWRMFYHQGTRAPHAEAAPVLP